MPRAQPGATLAIGGLRHKPYSDTGHLPIRYVSRLKSCLHYQIAFLQEKQTNSGHILHAAESVEIANMASGSD